MKQEWTTVLEHAVYQGDYRILRVASDGIGPLVLPGQFVHLRIPRLADAVLRRPFSVFKADAESLSILYKTVGKGTAAMQSVMPGEEVDLIGPLGNGFPLTAATTTHPVLVAGGYGNAALYLQACRLPVKGTAFFGGRTASDILCADEFRAAGWTVCVTTDDGTLGQRGWVTDALDPWLEAHSGVARETEIFSCGPNAMLRAVGQRATDRDIRAWLSMDRNMACGVGACLTCVIKRKTDGGWEWARCCNDGPVFAASEILWEEDDT